MRMQVLGPLRLWNSDNHEIPVASTRLRKILAALALEPDMIVTVSRLIDVVWPTDPPATARDQIQNCVSSLRRKLREADGQADIILHPAGYKICLPAGSLDSASFLVLFRRAHAALLKGDEQLCQSQLGEALRLWHGRALEDIGSDALAPAQVHLDELRVSAIVTYLEVAQRNEILDPDVIADLKRWTHTFPHHEQLAVSAARALHRCGRIAGALETIRQHKRRIAEDLGLDATAPILGLERAILQSAKAKSAKPSTADGQLDELVVVLKGVARQLSEAIHRMGRDEPVTGQPILVGRKQTRQPRRVRQPIGQRAAKALTVITGG